MKEKQMTAMPVSSVRVVQSQATLIYDQFLVLLHDGSSHVSCMIQNHGKVPEVQKKIII